MNLQIIRKSMVATALMGGLVLSNCGNDEPDTSDANTGQTVDGATNPIDAQLSGDSGVASDSGVPDSGVPDSGVPDSGVPDSGVPDSGVPDSSVALDAAVGSIRFADVHPIYQAKCGPCHTTGSFGGHSIGHSNINTAYNFSQLAAETINGTKGEATLFRIKSGEMPLGRNCTGDATLDINNPLCLNQQQQDLIQAWIDDGQLP